MVENQDVGRVGKPTGLSQVEPASGLQPSAFDPSRDDPLTRAEKLAAFFATVRAIDAGGCQVGFGRISRDDDMGLDLTFSLSSHMVRKVVAAFPDELASAKKLLADSDT